MQERDEPPNESYVFRGLEPDRNPRFEGAFPEILDPPPVQDASHHQDYYIFGRENPYKQNPNLNLYLPLASWVGGRSNLPCESLELRM